MKNGPLLWDAILASFPAGAVIAGGAVRDFLLGVEPKDIDVFYGHTVVGPTEPLKPGDTVDLSNISCVPDARLGLKRIDDQHERLTEYTSVTGINLVSSGSLYGYRVDAIEMENFAGGAALVEGFDFGITRCWYDGQLHDTRESVTDRLNLTVTQLMPSRASRTEGRFNRFNERMGGRYTLVPYQVAEAA